MVRETPRCDRGTLSRAAGPARSGSRRCQHCGASPVAQRRSAWSRSKTPFVSRRSRFPWKSARIDARAAHLSTCAVPGPRSKRLPSALSGSVQEVSTVFPDNPAACHTTLPRGLIPHPPDSGVWRARARQRPRRGLRGLPPINAEPRIPIRRRSPLRTSAPAQGTSRRREAKQACGSAKTLEEILWQESS